MKKHWIGIIAVAAALEGCATPPPPPAPVEDFNQGMAKSCTFTPIDLSASATASSTITMSNDGWCAVRTKEKDGQPYLLGLLRDRPAHGFVDIRKLGGETRIEYNAEPGYVGPDHFSVALRSRTPSVADAMVQVAVVVTAGAGAPIVAPPAPAPTAKPTPAPAKRAAAAKKTS